MSQIITLDEIYAPMEASLEKVPSAIIDILATPNALASEVIQYFFSGRGKLLRPAMTLIGAALKNPEFSTRVHTPLVRLSASYEIFHGATLIHDDIIDSSYLRRNLPTINVKWGAQTAVLVGDYLHDKALEVIYQEGSREVFSLFLKTAAEVCDGEIHELNEKQNFALSEEDYFEIIRKKTAVLLACALESGARYAGAGEAEARALYRFGHHFGMAFQIIDDCLDFTGNEYEFGKTLGADLETGVLTLPLIRLLKIAAPQERETIIRLFKAEGGAGKFRMLLDKIRNEKTIDYAVEKAREFSALARHELKGFSPSPARQSLDKLLDYVLERSR